MENALNELAIEILKEQGFEIGESAKYDERVLIRIRSKDDSALVETQCSRRTAEPSLRNLTREHYR
jgi:hypothetical protein